MKMPIEVEKTKTRLINVQQDDGSFRLKTITETEIVICCKLCIEDCQGSHCDEADSNHYDYICECPHCDECDDECCATFNAERHKLDAHKIERCAGDHPMDAEMIRGMDPKMLLYMDAETIQQMDAEMIRYVENAKAHEQMAAAGAPSLFDL